VGKNRHEDKTITNLNRDTMKKIFSIMTVAAALFTGYSTYKGQHSYELNDIALANVEALADTEGNQPEWWDFFNNYEIEERIPVNTTTCSNGVISYKGVSVSISSCSKYTYVVIHNSYDGGKRDECTSSHVAYYI
jgi:hypothetical protein